MWFRDEDRRGEYTATREKLFEERGRKVGTGPNISLGPRGFAPSTSLRAGSRETDEGVRRHMS
jgi:hypothetical protein